MRCGARPEPPDAAARMRVRTFGGRGPHRGLAMAARTKWQVIQGGRSEAGQARKRPRVRLSWLFGVGLALASAVAVAAPAWAEGAPAVLWQANDGATTVAFSKDGRLLANAGSGVSVTIRDAATGALVRTIRDKSGINSVDFSPSGALIAEGRTNGSSYNVKVYRVADGGLVLNLPGHSNATRAVAFSPDGTLLATGGDDKTAKLWRVSDGALLRTLAQASRVRSLAFSRDGASLAVGDQAGNVKTWRVSNGALVRTAGGFANQVTQVAYSPDGALLVASSLDGTLRWWRTSDGGLVRLTGLPASEPNGSSSTVAFTPDGAMLASGNDEVAPAPEHGTIRFYRMSDGAALGYFAQETDVYVSALAFSPSGSTFAYARRLDGVVTVAARP